MNESIECQLKVFVHVRQTMDVWIDRRMQDVSERYKDFPSFLGATDKR